MNWSALVPLGSALASALITGAVALRVVHVTQGKTNAREKEQREQQRKLKELKLEEARLQRLRDDGIRAYTDFARLTYTYKTTDPAAVVDVLAYSTIELLTESSETRDAADRLRTEIIQLREAADEAEWEEEQGRTTTTDVGLEYANQQVLDARDEFIRRAKDELGIDQL
jgi:hypothetical protein